MAILRDPDEYSTNTLYVDGNVLYAAGAVVYVLSSLRDDGWLDWLATGGSCAGGLDATHPIAIPAPRSLELGDAGAAGAAKRLFARAFGAPESIYGAIEAPGEASKLLGTPVRRI